MRRDFKRSPGLTTKRESITPVISLALKTFDAKPLPLWTDNLLSLEKTASTPSLKFCDLHPLLPVLAMDREDMSMGQEAAPSIIPSEHDPSSARPRRPFSSEATSFGQRTTCSVLQWRPQRCQAEPQGAGLLFLGGHAPQCGICLPLPNSIMTELNNSRLQFVNH